jgi:glucosamine-phosphate N-acetyltransferase
LIIGVGSIFLIERIRGGSAAVIEDIAVHEEWSNKGVGRLIVEKLLDYARSNNCFKVNLVTNDKNVIFYEKIGFKKDMLSMKLML